MQQSNVDEADGLASIPFGPHASLVNVDYLRLHGIEGESGSVASWESRTGGMEVWIGTSLPPT